MKKIIFTTSILFAFLFIKAQSVEVQGELKVTTVNQNDTISNVLVRKSDGTVGKRNVNTIGGEIPGTNTGDLKYWNGTSWTILPAGTPGQTLKVSPSNIPQWQSDGKTYIILQGNMTDTQAATQLSTDLGQNTQFIWIQNTTALTTIDLSGATNLIELKVNNNDALTNVNLNGLVKIVNSIDIYNNPNLSSISLPVLATVGGNINCNINPSLATFSLPALTSNGGDISCSNNPALTTFAMPVLTTNGGDLRCTNNPALPSVSLPLLTFNGDSISCFFNTTLTSFSLPLLNYNGGQISCQSNAALTTFSLPALTFSSAFDFYSNGALTSLSFPALSSSGTFQCTFNGALTSLSLPVLTNYNNQVFYGDNNALSSSNINDLLATFVALGTTPLTTISLEDQNPPAQPTGQGITDKDTLINMGKTVITD